jgi:uncharacterized protein YndB with AHSA1/START domain
MIRIVALIALVASAHDAVAGGKWERYANTSDGIVVDARVDKASNLAEIRAEAVIKAPIARVWKVLIDFSNYSKFMPYMERGEVIRNEGNFRWQYCRVDAPIVSKRDYTLKYDLSGAPKTLTWVADNTKGPKAKKKYVRVNLAKGSWTLTPTAGGKHTKAVYQLLTSPGGSIPLWVANMANKRAIPDIIRATRKRVKLPQYK